MGIGLSFGQCKRPEGVMNMELLETLGITSEVICAFFGVIIGWLIGISPSLYKRRQKR